MAEPLDTWHRHAKHNPQTLHTETADRIAQCTLWKHFIAGVGPRADHADTVELRPSRRASDSAFHGLQHRVRAELPCVHLIWIVIHTQTVPGSHRAATGRAHGASGDASEVPEGHRPWDGLRR